MIRRCKQVVGAVALSTLALTGLLAVGPVAPAQAEAVGAGTFELAGSTWGLPLAPTLSPYNEFRWDGPGVLTFSAGAALTDCDGYGRSYGSVAVENGSVELFCVGPGPLGLMKLYCPMTVNRVGAVMALVGWCRVEGLGGPHWGTAAGTFTWAPTQPDTFAIRRYALTGSIALGPV